MTWKQTTFTDIFGLVQRTRHENLAAVATTVAFEVGPSPEPQLRPSRAPGQVGNWASGRIGGTDHGRH